MYMANNLEKSRVEIRIHLKIVFKLTNVSLRPGLRPT